MKHIFAFYTHLDLTPHELILNDQTLMHRIGGVLRLGIGDEIELFSKTHSAHGRIDIITKKHIILTRTSLEQLKPLTPTITVYLPILQREHLEEALYALAALGATTIIPFTCIKSRHAWGAPKDYERAHSIMHAAGEQSKQFWIPQIKLCLPFEKVVAELSDTCIYFSPEGVALDATLDQRRNAQDLSFIIGPEGGFSEVEEESLARKSITACSLVPSIVTSHYAIIIGLGYIRTKLHSPQ